MTQVYFNPISDKFVNAEQFAALQTSEKISVIEHWFGTRFEDPIENTPFDEGELVYIWGGPHDTRDALGNFGFALDENLTEEIILKLEENGNEVWADIPTADDYDLDYGPSNPHEFFLEASYTVSLKYPLPEEPLLVPYVEDYFFNSLVYSHIVTIMEVYLADTLYAHLQMSNFLIDKFLAIEYVRKRNIKKEAALQKAREFTYQNLGLVDKFYKETLGVAVPNELLKDLIPLVGKRHDIVHRNCKTVGGTPFQVTKDEVLGLLEKVKAYVAAVQAEVNKMPDPPDVVF